MTNEERKAKARLLVERWQKHSSAWSWEEWVANEIEAAVADALAEQVEKHVSEMVDDRRRVQKIWHDELAEQRPGEKERIEAAIVEEREACAEIVMTTNCHEWATEKEKRERIANFIRLRVRSSGIPAGTKPISDKRDADIFGNCSLCGQFIGMGPCSSCHEYISGVGLIAKERQRQISQEGWTPEHDDKHTKGEMAEAAACYATARPGVISSFWPWDKSWWKPSTPIRNLGKAGALIAAEIDRLKRASPTDSEPDTRTVAHDPPAPVCRICRFNKVSHPMVVCHECAHRTTERVGASPVFTFQIPQPKDCHWRFS